MSAEDERLRDTLSERTILVAHESRQLREVFEDRELRVLTWPHVAIQPPGTFAALDEAIENLYGYDWLTFINAHSVHFFLERFNQPGHDVSELDSLRVCAIGETTATAIEEAQIHLDLVATELSAAAVVERLATFLGERDSLQRVNLLIPQAAIGRDYLINDLEEAGARADVVAGYQTVSGADITRLVALQTMLFTGSVDSVVFAKRSEVTDFARLFDTNDLGKLLKNTVVMAIGNDTTQAADSFGVSGKKKLTTASIELAVEALANRFTT